MCSGCIVPFVSAELPSNYPLVLTGWTRCWEGMTHRYCLWTAFYKAFESKRRIRWQIPDCFLVILLIVLRNHLVLQWYRHWHLLLYLDKYLCRLYRSGTLLSLRTCLAFMGKEWVLDLDFIIQSWSMFLVSRSSRAPYHLSRFWPEGASLNFFGFCSTNCRSLWEVQLTRKVFKSLGNDFHHVGGRGMSPHPSIAIVWNVGNLPGVEITGTWVYSKKTAHFQAVTKLGLNYSL